ncbi:MAG: hypothetical protein V1721_02510 [Pseudomonadota bacterium]
MPTRTPEYIVAVAGGGSHCRAVLCDKSENKVLRYSVLDQPANIASSRESTLEAIRKTLAEFSSFISSNPDSFRENTQLTLCLPGVSNTANVAWLKQQLDWPGTLHITSDTVADFFNVHGAMKNGAGILIGGTGSIAIGYNNGGFLRVGGRGDDADICSGYELGRRALLSAELRGNSRFQSRCRQIAEAHGLTSLDPQTSPRFIVSQLAPCLFDLAEEEHIPAVRTLIDAAAEGGVNYLRILSEQGINRFGVVGGVARRLLPTIECLIKREGVSMIIFPADETTGSTGSLNVARALDKNPDLLKTFNEMRRIDEIGKPSAL